MKLLELEQLAEKWRGQICLFGAGLIGTTWGYDLIRAAGFRIDFYCDNNISDGREIKNGICCIPIDELYHKREVLVFITVAIKNQIQIEKQLLQKGVCNIIHVDYYFMQKMAEEILAYDDSARMKRYRNIVDDAAYLKRQFRYQLGYELNLDHPRTFNEKLQWLKLYDRNPIYTRLVDKYEVKKYVADLMGEEFIIPTLGVYDTFEDIDFNSLPEQFVLKCTHDSGSVVFCGDKDHFDKDLAGKKLTEALERNYYWAKREWPYKGVEPRIIVEKYMADGMQKELTDYKFYCFNGEPLYLYVSIGLENHATASIFSKSSI